MTREAKDEGGMVPAHGLRAAAKSLFMVPQTASAMEHRPMWFHSWLQSLKSSLDLGTRANRRPTRSHRRDRWRRLHMEILEDRVVPTPVLSVPSANLAVNGSNGAVVSNSGTW